MWSDLDDGSRALVTRLYTAAVALVTVAVIGAGGYHVLGGGRWSFEDCLYMSIVTLSTVGFGELLPGMNDLGWARVWTVVLIVLGSGTLVYFASTFTALLVEGDLRGAMRRRRMTGLLENLDRHVIVCGIGSTGIHVAEELQASRTPFVVIDRELDRIERATAQLGRELLYVIGDATDDHVLEQAGIRRARGVIAALTEDRDNLFVVVTARSMSESVRIVSKAVEAENVSKLTRAGANAVVAPAHIGGVRLAAEMVRPAAVRLLDGMVHSHDDPRRIDELLVTADSPLVGKSLAEAGLRDGFDALVLAIRRVDGGHEVNPASTTVLAPGMVLIALVRTDELSELRSHVTGRG
ncbi:MAG: potassium channel protein [Myxococcota bacterium]